MLNWRGVTSFGLDGHHDAEDPEYREHHEHELEELFERIEELLSDRQEAAVDVVHLESEHQVDQHYLETES